MVRSSPARNRSLRVGLDVSTAGYHSGLRRYSCSLAATLADLAAQGEPLHLSLFLSSARGTIPAGLPAPADHVDYTLNRLPRRMPDSCFRWLEDRAIRPAQAAAQRLDVYHSLYLYQPQVAVPRVMTVHDLIPIRYPELVPPRYTAWFTALTRTIGTWADRIITDSRAAEQDLLAFDPRCAGKTEVVYPGVPTAFLAPVDPARIQETRERLNLHEPYLLYLGDSQPRKNLDRLLAAYARACAGRPDFPDLVIAGQPSDYTQTLDATAEYSLGVGDRVLFPGHIPDPDVRPLLAGAEAFVFPSLCEGFGIPPLEAMACGTPVVASNATSLPEVVGDAGLLVDPLDVEGLAAALVRIVTDGELRTHLRRAGPERARGFTWDHTARTLLRIYHELTEQRLTQKRTAR